jgi:NADPH2:quinone reductase
MRTGRYPFAPPFPFVPGYDVVGRVEAVGADVTTLAVGDRVAGLVVYGGYAEKLVRGASEFVRVPEELEAAEVVALILNYVTAWQMLHRVARLQEGQSALVTGASGGVGSALIELCREAKVTAYGPAAPAKQDVIRELGGIALDSRVGTVDGQVLARVPGGVDAAFDALGGRFTGACVRATRRGGHVVWYGFSAVTRGDGSTDLVGMARSALALYVGGPLRGRKVGFYGITRDYRKDPAPFREDIGKLLLLLRARRIRPRIADRIALAEVGAAQLRLERSEVAGKIVIVFPT